MPRIVFDLRLGSARDIPAEVWENMPGGFDRFLPDDEVEYVGADRDYIAVNYRGKRILFIMRKPELPSDILDEQIRRSDVVIVALRTGSSRLASTIADYHGAALLSLKLSNTERLAPYLRAFNIRDMRNDDAAYNLSLNLLAAFILEVLKWAASII